MGPVQGEQSFCYHLLDEETKGLGKVVGQRLRVMVGVMFFYLL